MSDEMVGMGAVRPRAGGVNRRRLLLAGSALAASAGLSSPLAVAPAAAQAANGQGSGKKPNIVIIWGDDIGNHELSCYSNGLMGFRTPNIDRVANEGVIFTDYYGEQSCTAGRSAFITGQSVLPNRP